MIDKLEAGKTYVFIDDDAKAEYLNVGDYNYLIVAESYDKGFYISSVECGAGFNGGCDALITEDEFELFKEAEPFDISKYEFTDCRNVKFIDLNEGSGDLCFEAHAFNSTAHFYFSKEDIEAMAKSIGLIG